MIRRLVIPDIHHKTDKADAIILRERCEEIYFLGDYFDDFYDTPADARRTAEWLKESLRKPNRIHLLGNHDLHYMSSNWRLRCAGFTEEKNAEITKVLTDADWKKTRFWIEIDGWLLTHAGFSNHNLPKGRDPIAFLREENRKAQRQTKTASDLHWFFEPGRSRGGLRMTGGILWCDAFDEFQPIPKLKQIFGHTPTSTREESAPYWIDEQNIDLDTSLSHYGILQNGKLHIKKF